MGVIMKNTDKKALIDTACRELLAYGVWDNRMRLKQTVKKYVLRRQTAAEDLIFWPNGLLAAGLWRCRQKAVQEDTAAQIDSALYRSFDRWRKKGMPLCYLDDLLFGETLLGMYEEFGHEGHEGLRQAADRLAEYALHYPTDKYGSFPYRANQQSGHVYVDMIGQVCPFLYRYGELFEKQEYKEISVRQITNFLNYGLDGQTGLPYHGYDGRDGCKYGIIGWGRAVGWLLRGIAGCMQTQYGRQKLEGAFLKLTEAALVYQRTDGSFSWQLQALEGPKDTSATAMVCVALQRGLELGVLAGESYEQALEKGKAALVGSIRDGKVYDCSGECEGFARYPQNYGAYPWALGAVLEII